MVRLFEDLTGQLWREIEAIDEGTKMRYITSVERLAIKKGRAEGKAEALLRMLRRRFHTVPYELEARVRTAYDDQFDEWSDRILDAETLSDVFVD